MTKPIDVVMVKFLINNGKLKTKINYLNEILLEDTQTGEAVKIFKLPETYSFHRRGKWNPVWEYTSTSIEHPMEGREAWSCSECGWTTDKRYDWCTCGADMRESKKLNAELQELLEVL